MDIIKNLLGRLAKLFHAHPIMALAGVVGLLFLTFLLFRGGGKASDYQYHTVERGNFVVSVVEGGTLEAVNEVVVRNELEGSSRVVYIVPEGSWVKEGDLVVELDAGEAEDELNEQQISYETKLAAQIAAKNDLVIMKSTVDSEIRAAELLLKFAEMDLLKFEQIEREQEERNAEIEIITAEEALKLAEEKLRWSKELEEKGFETKSNLDRDKLSVTNQSLGLEKAQSVKKMLTEYDLAKLHAQYVADRDEAVKELERVRKQGESKIAQATADYNSAEKTLELSKTKLAKMKEQFKATKLYAPQDGLVVYAASSSRYSSESMIEEGAQVRLRQELIKIPDTSQMKVEVKVHESHVGQVEEGLDAWVVLDSMPDKQFKGKVTKVGLLPDAQSRWGNPNLKVYSTEILIEDKLPDVKPGVSARAEIIVSTLKNVLTVPIQAVTTLKGKQVCYVSNFRGPKPAEVEVGLYNNKFIEIRTGLKAGDRVMLAPPLSVEADLAGGIVDEDTPISESSIDKRPAKKKPEGGGKPDRKQGRGSDGGEGGRSGGGGSEAQRKKMMERFDKNGDGKLDDAEREALKKQFSGGGGGRDGGKRGD